MKNVKAELIDLLDEITNNEVQIISFGLRQKAIALLKAINSDEPSEPEAIAKANECQRFADWRSF